MLKFNNVNFQFEFFIQIPKNATLVEPEFLTSPNLKNPNINTLNFFENLRPRKPNFTTSFSEFRLTKMITPKSLKKSRHMWRVSSVIIFKISSPDSNRKLGLLFSGTKNLRKFPFETFSNLY